MWGQKIVLFSFIVSLILLGVSNSAFATVTGSFDLNTIPINHSSILTITDTSLAGGGLTSITATVNVSPTGAPISVVLQEQSGDQGIFKSTFVKFKTSGASQSSPLPPELVVTYGNAISVKYPAGTEIDTATIFSPATSYFTNTIPASYNVLKTIPQQLVACAGVNPSTDSDQDGLCDVWETANGLNVVLPPAIGGSYSLACNVNATYIADPTGATVCPVVGIKDVYVEIDYMVGHKPNQDAINQVVEALLRNNIHLHVIVDEELLFHTDLLKFPGNTLTNKGFDYIKSKELGTDSERAADPAWVNTNWKAKMQVFYYYLWAHKQFSGTEASGLSEEGGNDGGVTLGAFDGSVGSQDQQAGTFMHELGHNFNLDHGGDETNLANCKPTMLSVMNHLYQFDDFGVSRPLEYSRFAIPSPGIESTIAGTTTSVGGYGQDTRTIVHGVGGGSTVLKNIPGNITWPADWHFIRTISDNQVPPHVVCSAPVTAVDLTSFDQWSLIDLTTRGTHWREGRGAGEPTSGPISLWTDYNTYSTGDVVKVSGTVSQINSGYVTIQVLSSNGNIITVAQPNMTSNGTFETTLTPGGLWNSGTPGEFTIKANHGGQITSVPIYVTDVASDEITIQNVRAARSVNVDIIIGEIELINSEILSEENKDKLIGDLESIRALVLSDNDEIIKAVTSYQELKESITLYVHDEEIVASLFKTIDRSIRPLTPESEPAFGISEPDTDGDRLSDILDMCDNTPENEINSINEDGCSPSEIDSDVDGVYDNIDRCPNTLPGTTVDAKGCPIFTDWWKVLLVVAIIIAIIIIIWKIISNRNKGKSLEKKP